jgi:hypothetical protein
MTERSEEYKQLNIRAPRAVYEQFHRLFPARGEKQAFFLKMIELALERGQKWSLVKQVQEEVAERYGED